MLKTLLPWAVSAGFSLGLPRVWISKLHEASSSHFSNEETKAQRRDYGSKREERSKSRYGWDACSVVLDSNTYVYCCACRVYLKRLGEGQGM